MVRAAEELVVREDLEELLIGLGLQAYISALKKEALDLEALSLAAAIDLRSVLKMPLGSALKLVKAANATEMATRSGILGRHGILAPHDDHGHKQWDEVILPACMEQVERPRSPSIVTQIDELDNEDLADQPVPLDQPSLPSQTQEEPERHSRKAMEAVKAKKVIDNSIMRRDILRYTSANDSCPPPVANVDALDSQHKIMRPHRWPLLHSLRHIMHLWGWFDPVMPVDHCATFKYNLYFSKGGDELKGHLMALSDMWVVGLSLLIGTMSELWGAFPEEGVPKPLLAIHTILIGSDLMASICAVFVFGVTYINVSAVHTENMHSYMVGAMGAFQVGETLLVLSVWLTLLITALTAYTKLYTMELDHWIWYVLLTVMYLIIVPSCVAAVLVFNRLTLETGYMRAVRGRKGPKRDQLTNSAKAPESALDHEFKQAWGRARQLRGRFKVLEKHLFLP